MNTAPPKLFETIKRETNGYLSAAVYRGIYEAARDAPAGSVIDIGPAQGGSTICLGLGRRDGGHPLRIYALDMFRGSNALASKTDTPRNIETLRANAARHGLDGGLRIIPVGDEDPRAVIPPDEPVGVLFIDADGALDRDFLAYFRQLAPGARIVLDDYKNVVNRHAREKYLNFTPAQEAKYVRSKGGASMRDLAPLGKEYSTWRFANLLIERGFVVTDRVEDSTLFARKPERAGLDDAFGEMAAAFSALRDEIHREYLALRGSRS